MSSKPSQVRTIDPFAEYNSNVANRLTRMLTQNDNVLLSRNSLSLELDSTSPLKIVVVQPGVAFKDDVLIEVTAEHQVDFDDNTHYVGGTAKLTEAGYYYVVLEYTYVKSRPAPDVDIKILLPSEKGQLATATSLMLIGVVKVSLFGAVFRIDQSNPLWDYDPTPGYTANRREYVKFYAGTETGLPAHDTFRDPSRVAYDAKTDKFWLGYSDRWEQINAGSTMNITTSGLAVGDLCYVDSTGVAQKAILTSVDQRAEFAVLEVGLESDGSGQGRLYGVVEDVPVEGVIAMSVGDVCYLSSTESGKVTNVKPTTGAYQNVGKCLAVNVGQTIDLLFIPGDFLNITQSISERLLAGASWTLSAGSYYQDVDISAIGHLNVVVSVRDEADNFMIQPQDVDLSVADTVRIWMPTQHASVLNITVVG